MNLSKFHDWTLVEVIFEWAQARVTVNLDGPSSMKCVLLAEEVSRLDMPKENPWGRSVSVNSLSVMAMPDREEQSLEMEMQSGDVIRINAKKIAVQE